MSPARPGVAGAGDHEGPPPRSVPLAGGSLCRHRSGAGQLDESARRLSHAELAVARQLVAEGHDVRSRPERPGLGPTSDLTVCGDAVEVKAFLARSERPGGAAPNARSVCNKLLDAARQAPSAVLYAKGSGLDEVTTRRGMRLLAERGGFARLSTVRVLGDRFDLSWGTPGRIAGRTPRSLGGADPPRGAVPELGW